MNKFTLASLLGVVVFGMTLWLALLSPEQIAHPVDGDTRDPVIAFEMVSSSPELTRVIGESRLQYPQLRDAMDRINRIDFIYMTAYGAFLSFFFLAVAEQRSDRRWLVFSAVAIVAMLADVRENLALLALTRDGADVLPLLGTLASSTWIKWGGLAIVALGAGYAIFEDKSMPTLRIIGLVVGLSAFGFTCASWADPFKFPQYMALAIFLIWVLQVVYAYRVGRSGSETSA